MRIAGGCLHNVYAATSGYLTGQVEGVGDLLNFNPDRELEFDSGRALEFDSRRKLGFDSGRQLGFNQNRDLGFGRRGIVFRGYVCPICGSMVTETATRCTECGAVFEGPPRASSPPAGGRLPESSTEAAGKATQRPTGKQAAVYCAYCAATLKGADTFCWNCGARTVGPAEVVRLPQQRQPKVTREWEREKGT